MSSSDATVLVVDATGSHLAQFAAAAARLPEGVRVAARSRDDLAGPGALDACVALAAEAAALILLPMGGSASIPGRDRLVAALAGRPVHVHAGLSSADEQGFAQAVCADFGSPAYLRRQAYLRRGGADNLAALMQQLLRDGGRDLPAPPPPAERPTEGIHHPAWTGGHDTDAYLAWARARLGADAPVLGLWFHHNAWANADLAPYDALIAEIEAQGGIPLPVFHVRFPDADLGNLTGAALVERFFKRRGRAVIDALLSPMSFSLARAGMDAEAMFAALDVPVLQLVVASSSAAAWEASAQGLSPVDVSMQVAQPEFDGAILGGVVATRELGAPDAATGARAVRREPVEERVRGLVAWAMNWVRLRRTPPAARKVAILFHHYPPKNHRLGCAFGLDSFASVVAMLERLKAEGYSVARDYADGDALAFDLLSRLTNDRRFLPPAEMARRAAARVPGERVARWADALPEAPRAEMARAWGPPPGVAFCHGGEALIGGVVNGNVFIGMQPSRVREAGEGEALDLPDGGLIHDPHLPPTHHYLAYYRWLREDFGAHAVVHVGMHGTLEWLPGKAVGLSGACYPEAILADLPNLYPYIVDNPGEGTQAKRRARALILDHMIPAQMGAGLAEPVQEIADLIERAGLAAQEDPAKVAMLAAEIRARAAAAHLDVPEGDDAAVLEALHDRITELATTAVADGLHVFGSPPQGARFNRTLAQFARLPNGGTPSLWEAIAAANRVGEAEALAQAEAAFAELDARGWDAATVAAVTAERFGGSARVRAALAFVAEVARPKLVQTTDELESFARGLAGRYVPPGGSGAPTRGSLDALPTGRNFYSVDPARIPTREAWTVGVAQGDALVARYRADHGRYPEQVGMVLWAGPTMRTRGDDVAEILYLIGVRPVWEAGSGRILGVEPIPLAERAFPRLDVTVRASGLLRDAFPNLMGLIDAATRMVAALDEPPEVNPLARNVAVDAAELVRAGVPPEEAARRARFRVFSDRPGTYGAGVNHLLESGEWRTVDDIAAV